MSNTKTPSKDPRIFHLLHIAHAALFRAADRVMRESEGITTAHQVILFTLVAENDLPSSEVARRTGHSKSRLTGLVDTLQAKNLIERRPSPEDGRVQILSVTEAGRAVITRTAAQTKALNKELLKPFSAKERETIRAFLEHVLTTADDA